VKLQDYLCTDMAYDPSGNFLALGSTLGTIKVFDAKKQSQTHEFIGKGGGTT
jgi:hypothetical protein